MDLAAIARYRHPIDFQGRPVTIRAYNPKTDAENVLTLWQTVFHNEMPFALWQWKYVSNPFDTAILVCEDDQGQPVVLYGGTPYTCRANGRTGVMIHLSDIMSHPDYRGSGLFIHTANAYFDLFGSQEETLLMYGFPGKYHFDIGDKYLKYTRFGKGAAYFVQDCNTLARQHPSPTSPKDPVSLVNPAARSDHGVSVQPFDTPDERMDALWARCRSAFPLAVVRDRAFWQWRFFDHPFNRYEVWGVFAGTAPDSPCRALAVLKSADRKAAIVDMLADRDSAPWVRELVGTLARELMSRGIKKMEAWFPDGHFMAEMCRHAGFKQKTEPIGIIPTIRMFDDALSVKWACDTGYYTMADGDLF